MSVVNMSSDLKRINRELLEDFIRAYQNQPCLWRIESSEYHDKAKRDAAYNILINKDRLIDKNADKDSVIKKINSFRTNYRREKKKVEASRHSSIGTEEIYEPSLWYYYLFEILPYQETRESSSNLNDREEEVEEISQCTEVFEESISENGPTTSGAQDTTGMPVESTSKKTPLTRPTKRGNNKCNSLLERIEEHFKNLKLKKDRYDILGKNVALKMRDISNSTQRLEAEKLINETLFMAEMSQLTMSHSILQPVNSVSTSQHINNNKRFPQHNNVQYSSVHSPIVTESSEKQSVASYYSEFGDV